MDAQSSAGPPVVERYWKNASYIDGEIEVEAAKQ
jgi:hypothetical protein